MPNPDFKNPKGLAKRWEAAGLAAPFDVESTPWTPANPAIDSPAVVDASKSI